MRFLMALQGPLGEVDIEHGSSASIVSATELTEGELLTLAMQFYDLQHTHIIHEETPDTKVTLFLNLIRILLDVLCP